MSVVVCGIVMRSESMSMRAGVLLIGVLLLEAILKF